MGSTHLLSDSQIQQFITNGYLQLHVDCGPNFHQEVYQQIESMFKEISVDKADRILTYCGGGIAASATAMLLVMLGFDNVSMYDASLSEWAPDKTLPMDTLD